ncbi:unnamed protein product [Phyllotreta striolata]|uniref:Uncharacterized protein n=1 Tax=Phyllotreta striolata TaxID=444603 RepID=A0A9N9TFP0_PHYSR|nr:unnamed protein product [Phyllotreta striolata]
MDSNKRNKKEKNPRVKASVLSLITFFYTFSLFRKGRKKTLEDEDIYEIPAWLSSEKLGNELEDTWLAQKKNSENPSLATAIFKSFGKGFLLLGVVQLAVKTVIIFIKPKALSKVVAYFEPNQKEISNNDLYTYAAILIGLNIFSTIYNHNFQQFQTELTIRVRTAVSALIFRKALKLDPHTLSNITMGKIVTLITKDVLAFDSALGFLNDMWIGVIHITAITYIIYNRIGGSVFGGIGFYLFIIPLQLFVGRRVSQKRTLAAKKTDNRLQLTAVTIKNIKTIKMYSWENFFHKGLDALRKSEISYLTPVYYLKAVVLIVASIAGNLTFFLMLITYIWTGHFTDAETIYYIQDCYASLKSYIQVSIPIGIAQCSDLHASLKRITDFLMADELTKRRTDAPLPRVLMKNVSSTINDTEVLKDVSLQVEKGVLLITGNMGSGKSSIIKTLLGECKVTGGQMVLDGTVSYASEEPWLFPSTIRQNILFGQAYNEKRYNEVLEACALTVDIKKLDKGDMTLVGDRGINFSKGQQARINLARAVYRNSDIYLIDDCLSSLDSRVNGYVFKKCILEFLQDKIVILVSNNINHAKLTYGKSILYVDCGRTLSLDDQKKGLDKRITYYIDDIDLNYFNDDSALNKEEIIDEADETTELIQKQQKIEKQLYHENKEAGKVKLGIYLRYYKYAGGIIMLVILAVIFIVTQAAFSFSEKALSWWVNNEPIVTNLIQNNQTNTTEYHDAIGKRNYLVNIYSVTILATLVLMIIRVYLNFYFALRASKNVHKKMANSVVNAYMTFFDKHLVGNIINRFSKDMSTMDETIPTNTYEIFRNTLAFVGILYLIVSVNTIFIIPTILLIVKLLIIQRFYLPTGRGVKRLEASSRSPMIGYLNAALEGLPVVRAYEKQSLLITEFDKHQDHFTSASYMVTCTGRFFSFNLDMVSTVFSAAVVIKFLFFKESEAGDVGLAISQAMMLTGLVQWLFKNYTDLENNMTGVERIMEYTDIEKEDRTKGEKFESWQINGKIQYKNVSLIYDTTKQKVLKNLNFEIKPKERVGIVGRTGAGKSSIISTLFRLYDIQGNILIDDVDTKRLSLEFLRSNMAIIPQDPILFSGTIRSNLDPKGNHADSELWKAIEKVNLKTLFLSLDEKITENGSNYSSGQRQLICLARALVSKNKIIVLDEATSNMDPETCNLIQTTIKQNFSGCTVLTIAHRLNTVADCDRVMVIDHGEIIEFDTPSALKANKEGIFYNMIQHSGIHD